MQDKRDSIERINNLSEHETKTIKSTISKFENSITKERYMDSIRYCSWLDKKIELNLKAGENDKIKQQDIKRMHPIRPKRGEVYLAELGQNIGAEINQRHLVLIIQNNKGNLYGNTVVVMPISSSGKIYLTHEKIEEKDIKQGKLDKLPSKVKTEQIQYMDKAKLIHKVGILEEKCIGRICDRLKKNLDIK